VSVVHVLQVELELVTPGGVAAPESLSIGSVLDPDLPIAKDGWGHPYIPGTSLAGSLRAHTPEEDRERLFGAVEEPQHGTRSKAVASAVRVLGTRLTLPDSETTVRSRTAIDRCRAAAHENTLHSRELLPPGTSLLLWLRIDTDTEHSQLVDGFVERMASWRPYIGGGRTVGHGHARLLRVLHRRIDLGTPEGLRDWLLRGGPDLVDEQAAVVFDHAKSGGPVKAEHVFGRPLQFRINDALHIGSGKRLERSDKTGVALVLRDHAERPFVPGTTWKGILRARCEFILRSVGIETCTSVGDAGPCGAQSCVTCGAFGWTERSGAHDDMPDRKLPLSVGARGRLLFNDSPIAGGRVRIRNHVALDRVFGGARDEALFAQETVEDGEMTLTIRVDGEVSEVARAVLLLALSDVADGRVGIGGSTTRGYGTLVAEPETAALITSQRAAAMATLRAHPGVSATEEVPA
jgi:CRISPR/Cas system CSM-associated protein Csm3 (group 7 of RAMP superfamily)